MNAFNLAARADRICDDLFVGPHPAHAMELAVLGDELGVGAVLSLQDANDQRRLGLTDPDTEQALATRGIRYLRLGIRDFDEADMRHRLPEAVAALARLAAERAPVYVHCTAGVGRSALVAAAFLAWVHGRDADHALQMVAERRPGAAPSRWALLAAEADLLRDGQTDAARALFPYPCD